jgi:hypothetical protein
MPSDPRDTPTGFILSESAMYAWRCQEVYPDLISFAAAIPPHLRSIFLIPIQLEMASQINKMAARVASRYADGPMPTGETDAADMFGTQTFVCYDEEPQITNSDPGSIFDIDEGWSGQTKHQEYDFDENIQVPTDTTFMEDVDMTQYWDYPYRTKEKPVRHSSEQSPRIVIIRLAVKPEALEPQTPAKIRKNAKKCKVELVSYDKRGRLMTFSVDSGNGPHKVRATLSDIDHIALNCDCNFWRWNGPEFHAKTNKYMLPPQHGTATPPDVRDPDRKYWLCKHAYSVIRHLDGFIQQIVDENWELDDEELLGAVDNNWDRLEAVAEIPLDDMEDEDPDIEIEWEALPADEEESETEEPERADTKSGEPEEELEEELDEETEPEGEPLEPKPEEPKLKPESEEELKK